MVPCPSWCLSGGVGMAMTCAKNRLVGPSQCEERRLTLCAPWVGGRENWWGKTRLGPGQGSDIVEGSLGSSGVREPPWVSAGPTNCTFGWRLWNQIFSRKRLPSLRSGGMGSLKQDKLQQRKAVVVSIHSSLLLLNWDLSDHATLIDKRFYPQCMDNSKTHGKGENPLSCWCSLYF